MLFFPPKICCSSSSSKINNEFEVLKLSVLKVGV